MRRDDYFKLSVCRNRLKSVFLPGQSLSRKKIMSAFLHLSSESKNAKKGVSLPTEFKGEE